MNLTARLADPSRRRKVVGVAAGAAVVLLYTKVILANPGGGRGVPNSIMFRGLVFGLVNSLTAVAIVLIYRINRIINFAQLAIGAAGAQLVFLFVRYTTVPFPVSFTLGLVFAAFLGAVIDLVFGRRFARSPRLVLTVITIVAALYVGAAVTPLITRLPFFPPLATRSIEDLLPSRILVGFLPFSGWHFTIGRGQLFGFPEIFALEFSVATLFVIGALLRYTKSGVAIRALAQNTDRAALLGVGIAALSTVVWAGAGLLSGATAVLNGMMLSPAAAFGFNPVQLLPALTAAVVARFRSLPIAAATAVGITIMLNATGYAASQHAGLENVAMFAVIAIALLSQRSELLRLEMVGTSSWQASSEVRPVPKELAGVAGLRVAKWSILGAAGLFVLIFPFVASVGVTTIGGNVAIVGIVALSLVVLTGWAGQVSLGQYAFVGVGAVVGGSLTAKTSIPFWFAVPIAAAIAALLAVIVGLPALRIRGLYLAAATFAFGAAVTSVLFNPRYFRWLLPRTVARPTLFFLHFSDERSMYFLDVAAFLLVVVIVVNLRSSRVGRLLIAVRENEANVQSFGVPPVRTKLLAFGISGALAGFAGAILVHQLRGIPVGGAGFTPVESFTIFVFTVIGGITSVVGALLGVAYQQASAHIVGRNQVLAQAVGVSPLVFLFAAPGGFIAILTQLRDGILRIVAQRRQIVVPSLFADYDPAAVGRQLIPLGAPLTSSGLAAMRSGERFTMESDLYEGKGSPTPQ